MLENHANIRTNTVKLECSLAAATEIFEFEDVSFEYALFDRSSSPLLIVNRQKGG